MRINFKLPATWNMASKKLLRGTLNLSLAAGILLGSSIAMGAGGPYGLPSLSRYDFNRLAQKSDIPLLWKGAAGQADQLVPENITTLGIGTPADRYIKKGKFTADFEKIYRNMVETKRREVVEFELDQARPLLVQSDLRNLSKAERECVNHIINAANMVEQIHSIQRGSAALTNKLPSDHPASRVLFNRNQGPWCVAPQTETNQFCNAIPSFPERVWNTYPTDVKQNSELCSTLSSHKNASDLLNPFTVVRKDKDDFKAVSLTQAYGKEMKKVAAELRKAAKAIKGTKEEALERYLLAAATAFETNKWEDADEAWAAMNGLNSKWYLRIGPDEVYWDLCQEKAGFHTSFALIDKRSIEWQEKLNPLRTEMETSLADLIGEPYKAREVNFQMPDFIEIVLNAGDARHALGGTIGQSLPNWGRVANEGRSRTVVMTNLYTDDDSKITSRERAALLLTKDTMESFTDDQLPGLIDIILHEATHNLGPYTDYRINGKTPGDIFGGRLASTLEELKAQTGALFYTDLLLRRGVINETMARQIYTHAVVWAFGHISSGMTTPEGNPKAYSRLAAVQIGVLTEAGAIEWADENGVSKFKINFEKMPEAVKSMMQKVGKVQATGDIKGGQDLIDAYVSGSKAHLVHADEIQSRLSNFPRVTFTYSVLLD